MVNGLPVEFNDIDTPSEKAVTPTIDGAEMDAIFEGIEDLDGWKRLKSLPKAEQEAFISSLTLDALEEGTPVTTEEIPNPKPEISRTEDLPVEESKINVTMKMARATGYFVGKDDLLYKNSQRIKPVDGYDDFVCHATPDTFLIRSGEEIPMSVKEYAEHIRDSSSFHNRPIRIISCQAGAKPDGIAKQLATELGYDVMAPTEIVNIDEDGRIFISDNEVLAELWYAAPVEQKQYYKETGEWVVFEP